MLTGNVRLLLDNTTTGLRNYGRVLLSSVGQRLNLLSCKVVHPWWELGDYLLADIGKTPADAEVEKMRRRPLMRDPREACLGS